MISPKERYSVLVFIPWLLGMLKVEHTLIEDDPDIDPQYLNGFVDCLETVRSYAKRYLGRKVWGELEADIKELTEKGRRRGSRKRKSLDFASFAL